MHPPLTLLLILCFECLLNHPFVLQVLAAANPHYGRYNVKKTISENINLPVALLSRFDLLFLLRDIANHELDMQLAIHVCSVHQFLKVCDNTKIPLHLYRQRAAGA
jgi:DNA replicative helicase MCM subunit Mcm2 (Cdc46/Mcm family)